MNDKIIEITKDKTQITSHRGFIEIENDNTVNKVAFNEILAIIISAHDTLVSKNVVNNLTENGSIIIYCDNKYLPSSITIPYIGHCHISERIPIQLFSSLPLQKNMWQSIIKNKIANQIKVLSYLKTNNNKIDKLKIIKNSVLSGDSKNAEANASRVYFKALFGDNFIRDRKADNINIFLNYGYIILRSAIARKICSAGMLPYIGIKHSNRQNSMPFVDDLVEPFRPFVDYLICKYFNEKKLNYDTNNVLLDSASKRAIASILAVEVETLIGTTNLNEAISIYVNSIYKTFENKSVEIHFPSLFFA